MCVALLGDGGDHKIFNDNRRLSDVGFVCFIYFLNETWPCRFVYFFELFFSFCICMYIRLELARKQMSQRNTLSACLFSATSSMFVSSSYTRRLSQSRTDVGEGDGGFSFQSLRADSVHAFRIEFITSMGIGGTYHNVPDKRLSRGSSARRNVLQRIIKSRPAYS